MVLVLFLHNYVKIKKIFIDVFRNLFGSHRRPLNTPSLDFQITSHKDQIGVPVLYRETGFEIFFYNFLLLAIQHPIIDCFSYYS